MKGTDGMITYFELLRLMKLNREPKAVVYYWDQERYEKTDKGYKGVNNGKYLSHAIAELFDKDILNEPVIKCL